MKRRSLPLWLLRDVPAFVGVLLSFWPLMILVIRSGFAAMRGKNVARSVFETIPILLAHAEARLDFALWREAYRRLGWNHRLVAINVFTPPQNWGETAQRFEAYRVANMTLEETVRAYVEHLRQQYGISKRDAAHGSTAAWLRHAAHHEAGVGCDVQTLFPLMVSSAQSARPSNHEGQQRAPPGAMGSRGPPITPNAKHPPRWPHLRDRPLMPKGDAPSSPRYHPPTHGSIHMKQTLLALAAALLAACSTLPLEASAQPAFKAEGKTLRQVYEYLHANPELSFQEKNSSAILAAEMKRLGFTVTTGVGDAWIKARAQKEYGKIQDGVGGYGVVAVLKNGPGPTIMIRADMDALPLTEKTGLPYASKLRDTSWSGETTGVMHACGHDIHMTTWIGTARELVARKSEWHGTLVMIAQPAEEIGLGALAMLEDGLFTRFPRPDKVIALHDHAALPAGELGIGSGYVMANVDSVDLKITGVGGHGAYPQDTKDPIVIGARIVTTLQTIVSREIPAGEPAVVTVGAFNGGFKHNIIPDDVEMQLTVRSFADTTRDKLLKAIERIARGEAMTGGLDPEKSVWMRTKDDFTPSLYNDPKLVERLGGVLGKIFPASSLHPATPSMGGEDFSRYGRTADKIPVMLLWLGAVAKDKYDASLKPGGKALPALHSSEFAPDPDPTLAAGVKAMTAAAIDLLK